MRLTKELSPETTIETLIPDVRSNWDALEMMISAVKKLFLIIWKPLKVSIVKFIHKQHVRSLEQIKRTKDFGKRTKSGIMVGLGETKDEVFKIMDDLLNHGCDVLTVGQYLQPTKKHIDIAEYVHPDIFEEYRLIGLEKDLTMLSQGQWCVHHIMLKDMFILNGKLL